MIPINEFYYQQGFGFDDNNLLRIYVKKGFTYKVESSKFHSEAE